MTEICINTFDEYKVGSIETGECWTQEENWTVIKVLVKEEVTREQYLEFVESQGYLERVKPSINNPSLRFYRVEILD